MSTNITLTPTLVTNSPTIMYTTTMIPSMISTDNDSNGGSMFAFLNLKLNQTEFTMIAVGIFVVLLLVVVGLMYYCRYKKRAIDTRKRIDVELGRVDTKTTWVTSTYKSKNHLNVDNQVITTTDGKKIVVLNKIETKPNRDETNTQLTPMEIEKKLTAEPVSSSDDDNQNGGHKGSFDLIRNDSTGMSGNDTGLSGHESQHNSGNDSGNDSENESGSSEGLYAKKQKINNIPGDNNQNNNDNNNDMDNGNNVQINIINENNELKDNNGDESDDSHVYIDASSNNIINNDDIDPIQQSILSNIKQSQIHLRQQSSSSTIDNNPEGNNINDNNVDINNPHHNMNNLQNPILMQNGTTSLEVGLIGSNDLPPSPDMGALNHVNNQSKLEPLNDEMETGIPNNNNNEYHINISNNIQQNNNIYNNEYGY